eukprot:CAMPEP_0204825220 /NCGR_PEP_ID=MMETSP1346-20131115/3140_1 /ASSEMBLY_ACC=CAM_ASM_000771 /TAXON_ID=215587 /ORGANISM="Aplanochytrium stocchinoi, Strain GSBS06" /LENGTH=493 /DNA_ID=CAMNT_0051952761 /DNA_START=102 /DNA_END=1583 /DNA_ORIENTATION=+
MDMNNPTHTEVMCLEGIKESWAPPREEGYEVVEQALVASGKLPLDNKATSMKVEKGIRSYSTVAQNTKRESGKNQVRSFSSSTRPTVGVIGGGVAGLQVMRALTAKGFDVKVFEQEEDVGGVWRSNYYNFGVQVPKQLFEFPDFPFVKVEWGAYPTGAQVQEYIREYVDHFDLGGGIHTSTAVCKVEQNEDKTWTFEIQGDIDNNGEQARRETFDYCVVSTGLYSNSKKFIPELLNRDQFKGVVIHSSEFTDLSQVEGKNVVVVGGGKSAVDCAVEASNTGAKVTLLSRQPHWATPRKIANLIPFQYVFLSRLGQALVVGYRGTLPEADLTHMKFWNRLGWPLMAGAFKAVEALFGAQFGNLTGKTSPFLKKDVVDDFYGYAQVLDYSMKEAVKNGKVNWEMGTCESFGENSLKLRDGKEIDADVVIFATGFQKDYNIFSDDVKSKLDIQNDGLYLWRHTVPANVPNLGFVGSELAVISNISGYGVQAAWLGE